MSLYKHEVNWEFYFFSEEYWCFKYNVKNKPNREVYKYAKEQSNKGYKIRLS